MKTTIKPRHEAQMTNMPLAVTPGACGFRIAHVSEHLHYSVLDQDHAGEVPIWYPDPAEAYRVMRQAQGVTAAMLATIFNTNGN